MAFGIARTDVERGDQIAHDAVDRPLVHPQKTAEVPQIGQDDVVTHRVRQHQSERAFVRHHADARCDGMRRVVRPHRTAVDAELRAILAVSRCAEDAAEQVSSAASEQAGEPGDLPGMKSEVRSLGGIEHDPARLVRTDGVLNVHRAPGHVDHEVGDQCGATREFRHHPTVAHHRAPVGDDGDLLEPMRDVQHCHALRLQPRDDLEQALDLAVLEGRGRLVQDQHPRVARERSGNRDRLALGEAERAGRRVEVRLEVQAGERLARQFPHTPRVHHSEAALREMAEHHVLGDRERRRDAQLLLNDRDARPESVCGGVEVDRLSVEEQAPAVGPVDPAERLDQGGLARAVLADERVHLPGREVERDLVERLDRVEPL